MTRGIRRAPDGQVEGSTIQGTGQDQFSSKSRKRPAKPRCRCDAYGLAPVLGVSQQLLSSRLSWSERIKLGDPDRAVDPGARFGKWSQRALAPVLGVDIATLSRRLAWSRSMQADGDPGRAVDPGVRFGKWTQTGLAPVLGVGNSVLSERLSWSKRIKLGDPDRAVDPGRRSPNRQAGDVGEKR